MNETTGRQWIDFEELKKTASVPAVLSALGLLDDMVRDGSEWKGQCPFHKGEGNIKPFCFHEDKRAFHCFACKRKGNVLDFVKQYLEWKNKGRVGVREAAEYIVSAMEGYTPKAREEEADEEASPLAVLEQEAAKTEKIKEPPKRKPKAETEKTGAKEGKKKPPRIEELNPEYFLDFVEACKLVSLKGASPRDFVAVRVEYINKVLSLLALTTR